MKLKSGTIESLVSEVDKAIAAARSAGLDETVALLRMARLDLIMRIHQITLGEMDQIAVALDGKSRGPKHPFN